MSFITSSLLVSDWLINSKCHITALFVFVDISTDGYYVAVKAPKVWYLIFNDHLKYHKVNNLRYLTKNNTKYQKMPILHQISAHSRTCGSDAITFVESMSSSEVILTVCHNLGLIGFSLPKMGEGVYTILVHTCENFLL